MMAASSMHLRLDGRHRTVQCMGTAAFHAYVCGRTQDVLTEISHAHLGSL